MGQMGWMGRRTKRSTSVLDKTSDVGCKYLKTLEGGITTVC